MTIEEKESFFLKTLPEDKIDFIEYFGNNREVDIEIGSGRGEFLEEIAGIEPERNFLGLECKRKRIKTILKKLDPETHSNVRLLRVTVDSVMLDKFVSGSVGRVYIFHPDPWPKRRHHKNRLINEPFLDSMSKILKKGGDVLVTTDHEEYMKWIINCFSDHAGFDSFFSGGHSREPFRSHIETHFEKKLKGKGYLPYYMRFIKG